MSTTIDEKVVEMRFDNAQFERNVANSMSTIEKLKRSLDFKGASKGLENLGSSARNVDMSPLGRSVDAVKSSFSVLETVATGALLRIGSKVADLGSRFVRAVTSMGGLNVENIMAGWSKFGDKTTSVATLVAQGYAIEEVNEQLDRLNKYTDETSYNFTDMVSNISKFTASGQNLTNSMTAMEGIANWAALSGQNAVVASRAMYQLSQAMGKGVLKYDDWRSIQNANMDTVEFRQNALDVAVALGKVTKAGNGLYQVGKQTFSMAEMFTSDALSRQKWFDSDVMMGTFKKYSSAVDEILSYAEENGITASQAIEELGDSIDEFGLKAFRAAQEARTWTDVVDSVKDAVSTGWMKTFELFIGNYQEAKTFYTQLANDFYDIFAGGAEHRNEVLYEGLSSSYEKFSKNISELAKELDGLSDSELEAKGYTREQADMLSELNKQIEDGTIDMKAYIDEISRPSGRENLAQSVYNIRDALFMVDEETGKAIGFIAVFKEAWAEVFPPITGSRIYDITVKIREFTERLIPTEKTADKLKRTFKGFFSVLDIGKQLISSVVRAIGLLTGNTSGFGDVILDTTSSIGDWLTRLSQTIKEHDVFFVVLQKVANGIRIVRDAIGQFIDYAAEKLKLPSLDEFMVSLKALPSIIKGKFSTDGIKRIREFISRIKELDGISLKNVQKVLKDFKDNVLDYFFDFSSLFGKVKTSTNESLKSISDFAEGTKDKTINAFEAIFQKMVQFKNKVFTVALTIRNKLTEQIGFGEIFAIGLGTAMVVYTKKIADAFKLLTSPIKGIYKVLKGLSLKLKAEAFETTSEAIKTIALSILMLVGALAILTHLDQEKLENAKKTLIALAVGMLAFSAASLAISKIGKQGETAGTAALILSFGASLLMLASALKQLDHLKNSKNSFLILTGLIAELLVVSKLIGTQKKTFSTAAMTMIGFVLSIKILIGTINDIGNLKLTDIGKTLASLLGIMLTLRLITSMFGKVSFGSGVGILASVIALKLLSKSLSDLQDIGTPTKAIQKIFGIFALLTAISSLSGKNASKAGVMILAMSGAIIGLSVAMVMLSHLDSSGLDRARSCIVTMLIIFGGLIAITRLAGEAKDVARTISVLTVGLSVLIAAIAVMSILDPDGLSRALTAITVLITVFAGLIAVTHFAKDATKSILLITGVITLLAGVLYVMDILKVDSAIQNAAALSILLLSLSAAFLILSKVDKFLKSALGTIAILTLIVAGLAGILYRMDQLNVDSAIQHAAALSLLLLSMSAACLILSKIGKGSFVAGIKGIGLLAILIAGIGAVIIGLGALFNNFAGLSKDIDTGIIILEKIGTGFGAFIGGIVGGAIGGLSSGLPIIGQNLSDFMNNIQPFLDGVKQIDSETVSGVSELAKALLIITGANIVGSLTSWLTGSSSISDFIPQLSAFGEGIVAFSNTVSGKIDTEAIKASAIAGKALAEMASELPNSGGLLGWIVGNNDMGDFVDQLVPFGQALKEYGDSVFGIQSDSIIESAKAGKAIAEMAASLPNSGGLLGDIVGNNDMSEFKKQLVPFGITLKDYGNAVSGLKIDDIITSTKAGKAIADMASEFPNSGGWLGDIVGNNDMSEFKKQLVPFGITLKDYGNAVSGLKIDDIIKSTKAGKALAEMASELPNSGGLLGSAYSLETFGEQLKIFGEDLAFYSNSVSNIDPQKLDGISQQIKSLIDITQNVGKIKTDTSLTKFGTSLVNFANNGIINVADAFETGGSKVAKSAEKMPDNALDAINRYQKSFYNAGLNNTQGFINGIQAKLASVKTAGETLGRTALNATKKTLDINSPSREYEMVGQNSGDGLVIGMNSKQKTAEAAGANLGNKALEGVEKAISGNGSNNRAVKIGENTGEDIATGFVSKFKSVAEKGKGIVKSVKEGSTEAIHGILTDVAEQSGLNKEDANWDWLKLLMGKNSDVESLTEETSAVNDLTTGYSSLTSAKSNFKRTSLSYISEEYQYLIKNLGEGMAIGFKNGIVSVEETLTSSLDEAIKAASKGVDAYEDWVDAKKYYNKLSLKEELAGWETLQKKYAVGSEERIKADREVYRIQNELVESTYQYAIDWMEEEKYYNRLTTKEELANYEKMQQRYMEGSKERMEIDKKVYTLRNQLMQESYDYSMNWIEREKYYNRMSLSDELAAYKRVQSRYAQGTEERSKMDREVYRLEQEIYEAQKQYISDVQAVREKAAQDRNDLEEEYAEKVESINERLVSDIQNLNDQYINSLESRTNSLYQTWGLFDKVNKREEVSGEQLLDNLQGQVEEFNEWQRALDGLSARGMNKELIGELQQLGPSSISQIKALESLSDDELDRYVALWELKHAQARGQATDELEDLRIETKNKIAMLQEEAEDELEDYRIIWKSKMRQIDIDAKAELEQLRKDFGEKVGLIKKETEAETQEMVDAAQKILEAAGWDDTGKQIVYGLITGIEDAKSSYLDTLTKMALEGIEVVKDTLEIQSPSRVFREIGNYAGLGLVYGLNDYASKSYDAGATIAEEAKDGLSDAMQTITDYLNGDLEAKPMIRPVLDLSDVSRGVNLLDNTFSNQRMLALAGQASYGFSVTTGDRDMTVHIDNDGVIRELRSLRGEMAEMTERMSRMQVVLDTGVLVGETIGKIDSALGQRQTYRGRGN